MRDIVAFILGNFTLTFFVIGLVASAIAIWRAPAPRSSALIVEELFAYLLLFSIGFLAFKGSFDLRLAAIVGPACFLWGAAGGHIYQMITAHNFAPGNAGAVFYSDVLLPIAGFIFLWLQHRSAPLQSAQKAAK